MLEHEGVVHIATTYERPGWGALCGWAPLDSPLVDDQAPTCLTCVGLQATMERLDAFFRQALEHKVGQAY